MRKVTKSLVTLGLCTTMLAGAFIRTARQIKIKIKIKIKIPAVPLMEHGSLQTAFSSRPIIRVEK